MADWQEVNSVDEDNVAEVNSVAKASIGKIMGLDTPIKPYVCCRYAYFYTLFSKTNK